MCLTLVLRHPSLDKPPCPPSSSACSSSPKLEPGADDRARARTRRITSETCCDSSQATTSSCSTAGTASGGPSSATLGKKEAQARLDAPDAPARRRPRPALSVRAAEARPARLYGAESDRARRERASPGHHAPHRGRAGQDASGCIANAVEAAEQCGILRVPEVMEPEKLAKLLDRLGRERGS